MKLPTHLSAAAPLLGLFPSMADVAEFHQTFGHPMQPKPTIPPPERQVLRAALIREEYLKEFDPAWHRCAELRKKIEQYKSIDGWKHCKEELTAALAELADAMADMIYVINGCALEYGIPLHLVWQAVQDANMSKVWKEVDEGFLASKYGTGYHAEPCPGGYVVYNSAGKVQKPPGWKEPDIKAIIRRAIDTDSSPA